MTEHLETLSRGIAYRWLAQFFLCPPALETYCNPEGQAFLSSCKTLPELAPCARLLEDMTAPTTDLEAAQARLTRAHNKAFAVGSSLSAPLYASVYLSERGLLFQQPARDMNRLLAKLGLSVPGTLNEPPDHLGIQLQVAAELCDRALSGNPCPVTAAHFLGDYVLTWLPHLLERCATQKEATLIVPFVRAALSLAQSDAALASDRKQAV
ncbi:molecular chaperone TorD family protein [Roseibium sp. HPY-6]|uniref:TorD/DmsD family molecular chaperone n=1 Tax=Roseibium sp. HPY-6 TaxID=3229852 RepID=UPI00338F2A6C